MSQREKDKARALAWIRETFLEFIDEDRLAELIAQVRAEALEEAARYFEERHALAPPRMQSIEVAHILRDMKARP